MLGGPTELYEDGLVRKLLVVASFVAVLGPAAAAQPISSGIWFDLTLPALPAA